MITTTGAPAALSPDLGYGFRDFTCLTIALAVHATLLLWRGGVFTMPEQDPQDNVLVSVNFVSEIPAYQAPAAEAPKQSLLSKMKSLIQGENHAPKPKVDVFAQKPVVSKPDALEITKGQTKDVSLITTPAPFKTVEPNLKQNSFKLATKDVPFKIATSKDQDALVNVNAIPVQVGPKTTTTAKVFDTAHTPALQSKAFAGHASSAGESLAMGGARPQTPVLAAGSNATNAAAVAGSARATGREWNAGAGFSGTTMANLPRNSATPFDGPADSAKSSVPKGSDFNISGALKNRPIMQKNVAKYEIDARVALRFRVDWSGRVLDGILVEISSGSPTFDQKVVASLKEWSFSRLPSDRSNEIQEGVITFVFKGV